KSLSVCRVSNINNPGQWDPPPGTFTTVYVDVSCPNHDYDGAATGRVACGQRTGEVPCPPTTSPTAARRVARPSRTGTACRREREADRRGAAGWGGDGALVTLTVRLASTSSS